MKKKIYLLRHGSPIIEGKRCIGLTDVPLSEEGKRQAKKMGTWLKRQEINEVYTSPLIRCLETAKIIAAEAFDNKMTIHICKDLREVSVGEWENLTFDEIKKRYPEEYKKRGENMGYYAPPGGESFVAASKRFENCLHYLMGEEKQDILVVAHAGVIRGYLTGLLGISANAVMDFPQPYGSLTILEVENTSEKTMVVRNVGWKPVELLDDEEIKGMYFECNTPKKVIRHMEAVAEYMDVIKNNCLEESQKKYHWSLLKKAALLHDIKRTEKNHPKKGADFLRKKGYTELADLIEFHHETGMIEDTVLTHEEILFYADKRIRKTQIVSLEERFAETKRKCVSSFAIEKHRKLYEKAVKIEEKMRCHFKPGVSNGFFEGLS